MQIPCVYLPGPAPAVSVANSNSFKKTKGSTAAALSGELLTFVEGHKVPFRRMSKNAPFFQNPCTGSKFEIPLKTLSVYVNRADSLIMQRNDMELFVKVCLMECQVKT